MKAEGDQGRRFETCARTPMTENAPSDDHVVRATQWLQGSVEVTELLGRERDLAVFVDVHPLGERMVHAA